MNSLARLAALGADHPGNTRIPWTSALLAAFRGPTGNTRRLHPRAAEPNANPRHPNGMAHPLDAIVERLSPALREAVGAAYNAGDSDCRARYTERLRRLRAAWNALLETKNDTWNYALNDMDKEVQGLWGEFVDALDEVVG